MTVPAGPSGRSGPNGHAAIQRGPARTARPLGRRLKKVCARHGRPGIGRRRVTGGWPRPTASLVEAQRCGAILEEGIPPNAIIGKTSDGNETDQHSRTPFGRGCERDSVGRFRNEYAITLRVPHALPRRSQRTPLPWRNRPQHFPIGEGLAR